MTMLERIEKTLDREREIKDIQHKILGMDITLKEERKSICRDLGGVGMYSIGKYIIEVTEDAQGRLNMKSFVGKTYTEPKSKEIKG